MWDVLRDKVIIPRRELSKIKAIVFGEEKKRRREKRFRVKREN